MAGGTTIVDRLNKLSGKDATTIAKALENVEEAGVGGEVNLPMDLSDLLDRSYYGSYSSSAPRLGARSISTNREAGISMEFAPECHVDYKNNKIYGSGYIPQVTSEGSIDYFLKAWTNDYKITHTTLNSIDDLPYSSNNFGIYAYGTYKDKDGNKKTWSTSLTDNLNGKILRIDRYKKTSDMLRDGYKVSFGDSYFVTSATNIFTREDEYGKKYYQYLKYELPIYFPDDASDVYLTGIGVVPLISKIRTDYIPFKEHNILFLWDNDFVDGVPNISNPDKTAIYIHNVAGEAGNVYEEWVFIKGSWEKLGTTNMKFPAPDWNVNDENDPSYIKNKPCYYVDNSEILYEGDLSFTSNAGTNYYGQSNVEFSRSVEFGTAITLNIDGLEYTDTVTSSHMYVGAANPGDSAITTTKVGAQMFQNGANTFGGMYMRMVSSSERGSGTYHVKVFIKAEPIIKQIDDIYLKNSNIKNGTGNYSVQHGYSGTASGDNSHAEGSGTTASGIQSHAEGNGTIANGRNSHAEGWSTVAFGSNTHSEGSGTHAKGTDSHAEGYYTIAKNKAQHVFGRFNEQDPSSYDSERYGKYVEIVGNGDTNTRSNCRTLDWSGNETLAGYLMIGGSLILGNGTEDKVTVTAAQLKALLALLDA